MRSFGVVPDQPINHLAVKFRNIVKFGLVLVNKFLLDATVKLFNMPVAVRLTRIIPVVFNPGFN